MDNVSRETRSAIMARVKSKGNRSTEKRFRALLTSYGLKGWRVTPDNLPGKPDFVFPEERVAIFVDGCFWHGCPRCFRMPQNSKSYWEKKIAKNVQRDRNISKKLRRQGWSVIRIWEHDVRERPKVSMNKVRRIVENRKV